MRRAEALRFGLDPEQARWEEIEQARAADAAQQRRQRQEGGP